MMHLILSTIITTTQLNATQNNSTSFQSEEYYTERWTPPPGWGQGEKREKIVARIGGSKTYHKALATET